MPCAPSHQAECRCRRLLRARVAQGRPPPACGTKTPGAEATAHLYVPLPQLWQDPLMKVAALPGKLAGFSSGGHKSRRNVRVSLACWRGPNRDRPDSAPPPTKLAPAGVPPTVPGEPNRGTRGAHPIPPARPQPPSHPTGAHHTQMLSACSTSPGLAPRSGCRGSSVHVRMSVSHIFATTMAIVSFELCNDMWCARGWL